jgi:hypothetical protein
MTRSYRVAVRAAVAGALAGTLACGAPAGRPNLPPPEYQQWPDRGDRAGSVPLADADAAVDVARREIHE